MTEARGKKSKKAQWLLSLGLKEAVFAGLGVAGLMMMSFALGTLAGRGDIYRVMHNWGLLGPEAIRAAQPWSAPGGGPGQTPAVHPAAAPPTAASPAPEAKGNPPEAVKASVTGSGTPAGAKKTSKPGVQAQKHKEEELRRLREEVSRKLKFQNSLDSGTKLARPTGKHKGKETEKTGVAKPSGGSVKVGQFRDKKAAQAKVAALQKQGDRATIKEGKDDQGVYYTVYRQGAGPAKSGQASGTSQPKTDKAPERQ